MPETNSRDRRWQGESEADRDSHRYLEKHRWAERGRDNQIETRSDGHAETEGDKQGRDKVRP